MNNKQGWKLIMDKAKFLVIVRNRSSYGFVRKILNILFILQLLIIIIMFIFSLESAVYTGRGTFNSTATAIGSATDDQKPYVPAKHSEGSGVKWEKFSTEIIFFAISLRIIVGLSLALSAYFLYQCSLVILDIGDATMHSAYVQHIAVLRSSND